MPPYKPKPTPSQTREGMGPGSVLNPKHEGPLRRPTEDACKLDDWPHPDEEGQTTDVPEESSGESKSG